MCLCVRVCGVRESDVVVCVWVCVRESDVCGVRVMCVCVCVDCARE